MTANHAHTPTTQKMSHVRDLYGIATAYDANDNASKHIQQIRAKNYAEFDEMIAEVIAAAEQRGAVKALRDAVKEDRMYNGISFFVPEEALLDRADQMESDDD